MTELYPCKKFMNEPLEAFQEKLHEEVSELDSAMSEFLNARDNDYIRWCRMMEEAADVQTVCESIMAKAGANISQRDAWRAFVYGKNKRRGYLDAPDK